MTKSILEYHDQTAYRRHRMSGHGLDWGTQPDVFKTYSGLATISLPEPTPWPTDNLFALLERDVAHSTPPEVDHNCLALILRLTHSLTAKARHGSVDFFYRSVASAGALYPFELYVGISNIPGLNSGLYHHRVARQGLTLLRAGNVNLALAGAVKTLRDTPPGLVFFLTSIFYRSSWKYRDRAYRYHLLDTGHLAENLALALTSMSVPFEVHYDFADEYVNGLLGLDPTREACLAVVCAWNQSSGASDSVDLTEPEIDLATASRVAVREANYPFIQEFHSATFPVVERPREGPRILHNLGPIVQESRKVGRVDESPDLMNYPEAVLKRRSMRNFVREELTADCVAALLKSLCHEMGAKNAFQPTGSEAVSVGLLVGNAERIDPGFYLLDRRHESIGPVCQGDMMDRMAHVCLDQAWLANCAIHFLFFSNLKLLEESRGLRGYRHAMLSAGRLGQRIYLAATSMRLGCCGVGAYYDEEAVELLGLNDQSRLLYLVAVGPVKKWLVK
ncbi:MAG: SagB/ThcOx family dehydrogenase [Desulfomonilaceae bacterium]